MAKSKAKLSARRGKPAAPSTAHDGDDLSLAIGSVGRMLSEVSNSLGPLSQLEQVADNLGHLNGLDGISQAIAGFTIAQYGTEDDRAKVVAHLKGWFWESGIFKES